MSKDHDHLLDNPIDPETARARVEAARLARRAAYTGLSVEAIELLQEQAWQEHAEVTERLIALAEEGIARLVSRNLPQASLIVLREDQSHGSPHGHLHHILDDKGKILVDGAAESWHHTDWSSGVDDYAWELHHLGRTYFSSDGHGRRVYNIPVSAK